ncbi:hypothetical protein SEUCBS139899_007308 [Sporothrix eucalyptigena]
MLPKTSSHMSIKGPLSLGNERHNPIISASDDKLSDQSCTSQALYQQWEGEYARDMVDNMSNFRPIRRSNTAYWAIFDENRRHMASSNGVNGNISYPPRGMPINLLSPPPLRSFFLDQLDAAMSVRGNVVRGNVSSSIHGNVSSSIRVNDSSSSSTDTSSPSSNSNACSTASTQMPQNDAVNNEAD